MSEPARTGLREAHAHIAQLGRSMSFCDLAGCTSAEQALARIAEHAADKPPNDWIIAQSARPEGWTEQAWFSKDALDDAVGGRPACVWCFDYHAAMGSSKGLQLARFNDSSQDPEGGILVRDAAGTLTGVLLESAALALWETIPEPPMRERREHVKAALEHLAALGYDEVHDLKAQPWLPNVLGDMARRGTLPCNVRLYPLMKDLGVVEMGKREWNSPAVRLAGGKIFVDGTLNSRTAWMTEPYADPIPGAETGAALMSVDQIAEALENCMRLGVGMAAHAIGDGAVRAVLDAVERVEPDPRERPGLTRIEHAELIHPSDLPRFAQLGVVASVQPCHLLPDIEALNRLLPDRLEHVLPIRALLESGATVWFGSDVPIVGADPADSIQAAVHRRRAGMDRAESIAPAQAIPEDAAWQCFTPSER